MTEKEAKQFLDELIANMRNNSTTYYELKIEHHELVAIEITRKLKKKIST